MSDPLLRKQTRTRKNGLNVTCSSSIISHEFHLSSMPKSAAPVIPSTFDVASNEVPSAHKKTVNLEYPSEVFLNSSFCFPMGSIGKSHAILIPLPAQGHIPPMIYLASKLAREGFTGQDIRLESVPLGIDMPNGFDEKLLDAQIVFLQAVMQMEESLAEIIKQIHQRGPSVNCVISDFFHLTAAYSAQRAGLPSVAFMPGMAAWASIEFNAPTLISNGDVPFTEGDDKLITYLPGLEPIRSRDIPFYLQNPAYEELGGEEMARFRSKRLDNLDSRVLVNTVYEFEPKTFDAVGAALGMEFSAIGPLFPLNWLDKRPPNSVLYISFGSISILSPEQFKEIALGLEASKQHFLWVNRPNSVSGMDEQFYQDFCERIKDRGLIISWSPQLQVLQHESTGGFLTHAGWNSIFESISGGVPMLGWPCMYEQNMNNKLMLEDKGLGISFVKTAGIVPREEIESKIKELMEGTEGMKVRKKAQELQELAMKAAKLGGSSHTNLTEFVSNVLL